MDFQRIAKAIASLKLMKYFPADEDACIELAKDLADMAQNEDQIEWCIKRVRNLYPEWPGIRELRAVFCSRFKPQDGINAYSTIYLDGIPPSKQSLVIAGPEQKSLPPGHVVSVDVKVERAVSVLVQTKKITHTMGGPATEGEIAAAPYWLRKIDGYE